jgi:hypothetical protein
MVVDGMHPGETLEVRVPADGVGRRPAREVMRGGATGSVDDYLRAQRRFGHLFADEAGAAIRADQASADETARRLGLPAFAGLVRTNGNGATGADSATAGRGE